MVVARGRRQVRDCTAKKARFQRALHLESLETRTLLSASEVSVGTPIPVLGDLNSPDRERSASISSDGLTLYFQRSESFALNGNFSTPVDTEIMVASRQSIQDPWGMPASVGPSINSDHPDTWPDISMDGDSLYFADTSDPPSLDDPRPGGEGLGDLWMSNRDGAQQWQIPVNLGPVVNSPYRDDTPELSADGLTLFFTSNRPGGSGNADLWMTTRESQSDPWQLPENLGATINSPYEDAHPSISPDGLALAFSSNRGAQGSDFWDVWVATRPSLQDAFDAPVNLRDQLPAGFQGTHGPEFGPDGSILYFDSRGDSPSNSFDLWEIPISIDRVVFSDSFEAGEWNGNWVEDAQDDWLTSSQRATEGNVSAEVDGRANDATLTLNNSIDLSGYDSAALRFDWLIESSFDTGEYLAVDVSSDGGDSWETLSQLSGNVDSENVWHASDIDIPTLSNDVRVRFRGSANRSNEDANVDNVRIVASGTLPPTAPTLSIEDIEVIEGDTGTTAATFTVRRSGDTSQPSSVAFSTGDGTAVAGTDYASASGIVDFATGESIKTIDIDILGDVLEELDESFFVALTSPIGANIGTPQATATIIDNDTAGNAVQVYLADIGFESRSRDRDWRVAVEVRTVDGDSLAAGVTLKVDFNGATYAVETNSHGIARTPWQRNLASGMHIADAYDLAVDDLDYEWIPFLFDAEDDVDDDGKPDDVLIVA